MAKPRIFISSTFYDMRQIRADLDSFIQDLGYECVRNEVGTIPYGKDERLENYCYKEIANSDILISIIGGRFGSESKSNDADSDIESRSSISQKELQTAIENKKQVYIFIEKNVQAEFETYLLNKSAENIKYRYVDDVRIYKFIETIRTLDSNNNTKDFETVTDITTYLKEQFAGLFQRFLDQQERTKEINLIKEMKSTSETLNNLVKFLRDQNTDQAQQIDEILMISHPLINKLKECLNINFNFYIRGYSDLNNLLASRGYKPSTSSDETEEDKYYEWTSSYPDGYDTLRISRNLFDDGNSLKNILAADWQTDYVELIRSQFAQFISSDDDLPF